MKNIAILIISVLMVGCAGNALKDTPYSLTENPTTELSKLENSLAEAKGNKIHLLSPGWYNRAKTSYNTAKTLHETDGKPKAILSKLAKGRAQLNKAIETADVSRSSLKTLNQIRKRALTAGADTDTKGFNDAEESYLELTTAVEKGKLSWVNKNKEEVTEKYLDVELEAIKNKALDPARKALKQATAMEAEEYAPKSLQEAKTYLKESAKYITRNRHEVANIKERSDKALFLANRTKNITNYSKYVKDHSPEEVALWVEEHTNKLSGAINQDYRDLGFREQYMSLHNQISNLRGGRDNLAGELSILKVNTASKKKEFEQLKKMREFNKKYAKVRRYFKKSEADVYKEGDKLVIRLKSVKFPSGKSVLLSKNYALMNKVKKAIAAFEESNVIIEGHTDSRGAAKTNMRISKDRANSVRDYILANSNISKKRVKSKGLGFKRPIATNKTEKGRSTNRRIDIIINPSSENLVGGL